MSWLTSWLPWGGSSKELQPQKTDSVKPKISDCEKLRYLDEKPEVSINEKGKYNYVWAEVKGNPNLYCWIKKTDSDILSVDIDDVNIQDIPPPPANDPPFEKMIAELADTAEANKKADSIKKARENPDDDRAKVSADLPEKYDIVRKFISRKGLKVYGGTAINALLPKDKKIYKATDIPDYDVFSPDPWNDAVELADEFYKNGYKYVETRSGIHKGTYKVFVDLWPVVDMTHMKKKDFDKIETRKIDGIQIVGPYKLLEAFYKEFSEPYANASRWPKVAVREKLFSNALNPLGEQFKCSELLFTGGKTKIGELHSHLLEKTYEYILHKKLLFTGPLAYNTYIEVGGGNKRVLVNNYKVLSEKPDEDVKNLMTDLLKIHPEINTSTTYYSSRELNNTVYRISAVIENIEQPIVSFIHLTSCTPYHIVLERPVVSIDYLFYDLYDEAVFADDIQDRVDAKCKIQYLSQIQQAYYKAKNISELAVSPFQRFIIKCKGPYQHNIKVEILNRWLDRVNGKDKVIREWTSTHRIRKIPRDEIPGECQGKGKDVCKYPCAWNKFVGLCTGIPRGIYRPDEADPDMIRQYIGDGMEEEI